MSKRRKLLIDALNKDKDAYLSGRIRPILRYRKSKYDSVRGYSWIDFYLNESPVPLFCAKTLQFEWYSFAEKILDEMQKVAIQWRNENATPEANRGE